MNPRKSMPKPKPTRCVASQDVGRVKVALSLTIPSDGTVPRPENGWPFVTAGLLDAVSKVIADEIAKVQP